MIAQTIFMPLSRIESGMTGVSHLKLPLRGSNLCTAVYADGTEEAAEIRPEQAKQFRAYMAYQDGGEYADAPNAFALIGEIQAKRREGRA